MFRTKGFYLFFCILSFIIKGLADPDPLPSWNEGLSKQKILQFVQEITEKSSEYFIPESDRIAVFDEDGTLWVEKPLYVEFIYAIESFQKLTHLPDISKEILKYLFHHDLAGLQGLSKLKIKEMIAKTHAGISVENFHKDVTSWLETALHPRFKKPYTQLIYQPMVEVMQLLKDHGFEIYIVSGGGQEFIRAFAEKVYGIPPSHVIGTAYKVKYEYNKGQPFLLKLPEILFINDKEGKPEGINLVIGKRPVAAFGNSTGDQQMLEWTFSTPGKRLALLVHHDDPVREYSYGPNSKIGTFSQALMDEAIELGWIVVSMKNDWKTLFPN